MLKLSEFSHNHYTSGVKMLAKYIRRGILVFLIGVVNHAEKKGNL